MVASIAMMKECHQATLVFPGTLDVNRAAAIQTVSMAQGLKRQGVAVGIVALRGQDQTQQGFNTEQFRFYHELSPKFSKFLSLVWPLVTPNRAGFLLTRHVGAAFIGSLLGSEVILELHQPLKRFGLKRLVIRKWFGFSPRAPHVVAITAALARDLESSWPELRGKVSVLPDGADVTDTPRTMTPTSRDRPAVAYAGHFYVGKGAELIPRIAEICSEIDFHLYGGSAEQFMEIHGQRDELPNLFFHTWIHPGCVGSELSRHEVLLLPNQRAVILENGVDIGPWTSPLKLFQYMAVGRPIVASNIEPIREILRDGENGLLCSPTNVEEWVSAIRKLISEPEISLRLASAAWKEVSEKYSWDARASTMLDLLR